VGCTLVLAFIAWHAAFDTSASATTVLARAAVFLPLIGVLAAAVAFVVHAFQSGSAGDIEERPNPLAEHEQRKHELELALERRRMRRELAAKLADEYRINPAQVPGGALRAAVVASDASEEECAGLERALFRVRSSVQSSSQKGQPRPTRQ
jgi:hypothetical protein